MIQKNKRPTLSEKGLLTPDNSVVTIIDLQPQMLFGVSNFDRQLVINKQPDPRQGSAGFRRAGRAVNGGNQSVQRPVSD
jgi:hypothetical protein